jgi:hypothetical protein
MLGRLFKQSRKAKVDPQRIAILTTFFSPNYQKHNLARLTHLQGLGLELQGKRVLEVGAGVGDHTLFYIYQGCMVLPTDARPELVAFIQERLGIEARLLDVDREPERLRELGTFDILHCYGLLYHLSNPRAFLTNAAMVTGQILLETCVTHPSRYSTEQKEIPLSAENAQNPSQAVHGLGCRPTREWVFKTLKECFPYTYCPTTQPRHSEFPLSWEARDQPQAELTRAIFVASHQPISSSNLVDRLPARYDA